MTSVDSNLTELSKYFTLSNGDRMPAIGLGTAAHDAVKGAVKEAVKVALRAGYRHIDGAFGYNNEAEIGEGLKESGVPREEVWLTSKLPNRFHTPEDIEPVLDESLARLQTAYLDLYLIHWPVSVVKEFRIDGKLYTESERVSNSIPIWKATEAHGPDGKVIVRPDLTEDVLPTWKALEALVKKGKIKNLGLSNWNIRKLKKLLESDVGVRPTVNQVELSHWVPQPELVQWSKENGIVSQGFSPLGGGKRTKETLALPEVQEVAKELSLTPAQVILSWSIQRGTVVLVKSVTPSRIVENLHVIPLPKPAFEKVENAATSHPIQRVVDPSKDWNLDIFEDGV